MDREKERKKGKVVASKNTCDFQKNYQVKEDKDLIVYRNQLKQIINLKFKDIFKQMMRPF